MSVVGAEILQQFQCSVFGWRKEVVNQCLELEEHLVFALNPFTTVMSFEKRPVKVETFKPFCLLFCTGM